MKHLVESGGVVRSCCAMMEQYGALGDGEGSRPHGHDIEADRRAADEERAEREEREAKPASEPEAMREPSPGSASGPGTRGL
jgi:hypothetical protein